MTTNLFHFLQKEITHLRTIVLEQEFRNQEWQKQYDELNKAAEKLAEALVYAGGLVGVPLDKVRVGGDGFTSTAKHIAEKALTEYREKFPKDEK